MLGSTATFRASRLAQGGLTRSRRVSDSTSNLAATAGVGAAVFLFFASSSTIGTRPSVDTTSCPVDSRYVASDLREKIMRLWLSDYSLRSLLSCPSLLQTNRAQCDVSSADSQGLHYSENEQELDDDSGYTEADRFWQCLDYHRSLLHDYHRRWGPQLVLLVESNGSDADSRSLVNDKDANHSAQWPRNIPTSSEVSALEYDLCFCERSPNYCDHIRTCQDKKFRIATYYATQPDEESQRQGFRFVKELAEQGHPDGMCYYGKCSC